MSSKSKCDCLTFYCFDGQVLCLHKLFQHNMIKIIVREVTDNGVLFWIYADKPKESSQAWKRGWWRNGRKALVRDRDNILLAIELAKKHQVKKVRIGDE